MPLRDDLLTPIPGDNPSGVSLRYDPVTDKIKEARREEDEAPQGAWARARKVADFPQVIKLASDALAKKGKDLQVAVWLAEAHIRREGFPVLPSCIQFLHDLVEQFWDTIYPEIEDGDMEMRAAPLEWFGTKMDVPLRILPITSNKLSWAQYKESRSIPREEDASGEVNYAKRQEAIKDAKITPEEFDAAVDETPKAYCEKLHNDLQASLSALETLTEFCDSKFGDVSPSFINLRGAIEEIANTVHIFINQKGGPTEAPAAEEEAPGEEAYAEPAAAAAEATPEPSAAPKRAAAGTVVGLEPASKDDAGKRLVAIARYLRQQDEYDISAYLILRGWRWGELRYNGVNIDAKMLEAPPTELRTELKSAVLEGDAKKILAVVEKAMELPCGRGWLDLQRYAVKAFESLGQWYVQMADAIRSELRGLLHDLPALLEMTMMDDTPTANAETLAWIRSDVLPLESADGAAQAAPEPELEPEPEPEPVTLEEAPSMEEETVLAQAPPDAFELAMEAARGGHPIEAIEILSRELAQERSGRGRFKRRMQIAHICMASGREQIAYPILDELSHEIDLRKLEEWEAGDVLAYPLTLLLRCLSQVDGDPETKKQIYARICRLDPLKALNCSG